MAISGQPPVAYYPLGGSSTGSSSTLTTPNESVPSATVFDFDNSDSDVVNTSYDIVSGNKTISFWFNSSYAGYQCIMGNTNDSFILGTFTSQIPMPNGVSYTQGSSGKTFGVTASVTDEFADGNWHHFVYTYDGNSKIYIDGTERTISYKSGTTSSDDIVVIDNLGLGLNRSSYPKYTGKLSNVQAWNTSLSSVEVTTLYNNGVPLLSGTQPQTANLRAWWKMNVDNANWLGSDWQIPEATSAYPQSFDFGDANTGSEYITNTYFPNGESNFTYSTWLNANFYQRGTPIAAYGGSTHQNFMLTFWTGAGGTMYLYIGNGNYGQLNNVNSYVSTGWVNFSFVYDGSFTASDTATQNAGRIKLYINGTYQTFDSFGGTIPSTIPSGNTGFYLGTQTPTTYEYGGEMSNVMMFDNSLPATGTDSVETLYNNGSPLTTAIASSNLKAWYKLDNTETYLKPPPSQTQNLYEAWLIQNQKYPASVDNCLLFANQNYIRYDNFDLINEAELTLSFWYLHNQSINSSDRLIGSWFWRFFK
jgi:hypothetical protein